MTAFPGPHLESGRLRYFNKPVIHLVFLDYQDLWQQSGHILWLYLSHDPTFWLNSCPTVCRIPLAPLGL